MVDVAEVAEQEWQALLRAGGLDDPQSAQVDVRDSDLPMGDRLRALRELVIDVAAEVRASVAAATEPELTGWLAQLEQLANCLPAADQAVLAELDRRGTALEWGYPNLPRYLTGELRVRPAVAARRIAAARELGPRRAITGEPLAPRRELVAAAQATGRISADHAVVISRVFAELPTTVPPDAVAELERTLLELAERADPTEVARAGRYALQLWDPDGQEPRDEHAERRRGVVISGSDDGVGRITGTLTPPALAALQAVLSPLAAPRPADDAGSDPRSPAQRMHDGLLDACDRLLRSGSLPDSGGTPATVIVTLTEAELRARTGIATTTFGTTLSVAQLLKWAAECDYVPVVLADTGGVLGYGRSRRVASPGQTKALIARDRGCSVPGCQTPAEWCQRHHVVPHVAGGPTDLANLALVCSYHHRALFNKGWECVMLRGRPHWRAPAHIDPDRRLRRNTHWDVADVGPPG